MKLPIMKIYTDGSCRPNPGGPMGIGLVILHGEGGVSEIQEAFPTGTNNLAELLAIKKAAEIASIGAEILTDSKWAQGILIDGWKIREHKELVLQVRDVIRDKMLSIRWVRGHHGDPHNTRADELAQDAVENYTAGLGMAEAA